MGVETPELQIYHVNEEGIYKMRNGTETNTLAIGKSASFSCSMKEGGMSFSASGAAAVMTAGHREEREASEMNGG